MNSANAAGVLVHVSRVISGLSVAALVLAGCTGEPGAGMDAATQTSSATPGHATTSSAALTTPTFAVRDLASIAIDLLDGSGLNVVGPAQLELAAYVYFVEISGLGVANVYLSRHVDPATAAEVEDTEFHSDPWQRGQAVGGRT